MKPDTVKTSAGEERIHPVTLEWKRGKWSGAREVLAGPRLSVILVQLGGLFENWKKAGWESPEFTVTFLRSDDESSQRF